MKKILFYLLIAATAYVLSYSAAVIIAARSATPKLVKGILESATITYKDLSKWQLDALLAVEDPKFFEHNGVDLKTPGAGITTITQGLAKRLYFKKGFRPGIAKYKLMVVSVFALDRMVSKNDQLTLLLNNAHLGNVGAAQVIGFDKASEVYFKKKYKDISRRQYLQLVAMLIAPNAFNVINQPDANRERVARIEKVISGEYKPKSLMDLYYGELPKETAKSGLAPASYFPEMYKKK